MGLPGPLRRDTGEVGDSAIMPGWIGTRPEALMSERLGLPVRVENDANLGALAEIVWGAGRGCSRPRVRQGGDRRSAPGSCSAGGCTAARAARRGRSAT